MYQKISCQITDWLILKKIISHEEKDIYQYSVEVLVSDFLYMSIAVLTAIITDALIASMAFFVGFLTLRRFSGGYHASTYLRCHCLFWLNQLIMIIMYKLISIEYTRILSLSFILLSAFCVFILAPVGNENKPLSVNEKRKYGFLSKLIIIFDAAIVIALSITEVYCQYVCMYAFGVFSVSISLVAEKIKILKKRREQL